MSEERGNSLMNCLPPLGILSIAAFVESRGYRVGVVDVHAEKLIDADVIERLKAARPRVVGISVLDEHGRAGALHRPAVQATQFPTRS